MGAGEVAWLAERSRALQDTLARSRAASDKMVSILTTFDTRLIALESAMRPIQVKTNDFRKSHLNIDAMVKAVEMVLSKFNLPRQVEPRLKEGIQDNLHSYLASLHELEDAMSFFEAHPGLKHGEVLLSHAKGLRKEALAKLLAQFSEVLQAHAKELDQSVLFEALPKQQIGQLEGSQEGLEREAASKVDLSNEAVGGDTADSMKAEKQEEMQALLPASIVETLHLVAVQAVASGAAQECILSYRKARREWMEQMLKRLGIEDLSKEEIFRMSWELLQEKIGSWIEQIRVTMMVLFVGERKLCDAVFEGLDPHREQIFAEVVEHGVGMLLTFGEAVADSHKAPEKLFVLLDMYETMKKLLPQMEMAFAGKACAPAFERAQMLLQRLAGSAQSTFVEFESAVERDTHKATVVDGTVHPLTSYVVNYVKFLFDYESTLAQIFEKDDKGTSLKAGESKAQSRLAVATKQILTVLLSNLEAKAKTYKDPALMHIFLMNNVHYMVRAVKRSEVAAQLLGTDWLERHRRVVQQHASSYQRTGWGKVIGHVTTQGLPPESTLTKKAIKERFRAFNAAVEELHARQSAWSIPESSLREAVLLAVGEVLLPAYSAFVRRCTPILETYSTSVEKYMKYSQEQLETLLQEFFSGNSATSSR